MASSIRNILICNHSKNFTCVLIPVRFKGVKFTGLPHKLKKRTYRNYKETIHEIDTTSVADRPEEEILQYVRKAQGELFGQYGFRSGVTPTHLWPSREQVEDLQECESLDPSLQELMERDKTEREFKEMVVSERLKTVEENMKKMPELIEKFRENEAKRKDKLGEANETAVRLQEEAREHFGFNISRLDPRYQEWKVKRSGEITKQKKLQRQEKKAKQGKEVAKEEAEET